MSQLLSWVWLGRRGRGRWGGFSQNGVGGRARKSVESAHLFLILQTWAWHWISSFSSVNPCIRSSSYFTPLFTGNTAASPSCSSRPINSPRRYFGNSRVRSTRSILPSSLPSSLSHRRRQFDVRRTSSTTFTSEKNGWFEFGSLTNLANSLLPHKALTTSLRRARSRSPLCRWLPGTPSRRVTDGSSASFPPAASAMVSAGREGGKARGGEEIEGGNR